MLIECERCEMQGTEHCKECVVTFMMKPSAVEGAVVIDADEERALREMARVGLIPEIRMRPRDRPA